MLLVICLHCSEYSVSHYMWQCVASPILHANEAQAVAGRQACGTHPAVLEAVQGHSRLEGKNPDLMSMSPTPSVMMVLF